MFKLYKKESKELIQECIVKKMNLREASFDESILYAYLLKLEKRKEFNKSIRETAIGSTCISGLIVYQIYDSINRNMTEISPLNITFLIGVIITITAVVAEVRCVGKYFSKEKATPQEKEDLKKFSLAQITDMLIQTKARIENIDKEIEELDSFIKETKNDLKLIDNYESGNYKEIFDLIVQKESLFFDNEEEAEEFKILKMKYVTEKLGR